MTDRRGSWPAVLALLCVLACDIPTGTPDWDLTMLVPGDSTSMTVAKLLPPQVALTSDKSAFLLSISPVNFRSSLGQMCSACGPLHGTVVAKPDFSFTITDQVKLPADVPSAAVSSGSVEIRLTNNLNFDPVRPSTTGSRGAISTRLVHSGSTISADTVRGETTAFAPGSTLTRTLALRPTTITGPISVEILVSSPAGDPVQVDTTRSVDVRATPQNLRVSEARVTVASRSVDVEDVEIDLEDIDDEGVINRVVLGALIIDLTNPFAVSGNLSVRITPTGRSQITKSLSVASGTNTQRLQMSGQELRSMLSKKSKFSAAGSLSASGGSVTVRPTQILVIKSKIELTVSIKER